MGYEWALPQLRRVLPLDDSELLQVLARAGDLPDSKAAGYFQSLLGESPEALEFMAFFAARRAELSHSGTSKPRYVSSSAACKDPVHGFTNTRPHNMPPFQTGSQMPAVRHHTNAVIEAGKWRARDEVTRYAHCQ